MDKHHIIFSVRLIGAYGSPYVTFFKPKMEYFNQCCMKWQVRTHGPIFDTLIDEKFASDSEIIKLWRIGEQPVTSGFFDIMYGINSLPSEFLGRRAHANIAFRKKPPRRQYSVVMSDSEYARLAKRDKCLK